jgi:multiple sugar transport system ATP-binding protein
MAGLELKAIRKSFGTTEILKGVDLEIADGEFVVLVGPSGCGKSTLLRCIAGLEAITDGELRIGARRVNELAPKDRDIAMVFQSYALYPHMTVRKNMAFGLEIRRMKKSEIETRVAEAAALLGLEDLLERYPRQLSGGQRQRVAMGRAIVRQPEVFLFDEPLSNLDAALRVQMRVELARLHQRMGTTMIYVTHDQVEAMTLADRIVVLKLGEVQQVGAPLELYHRPANRFVAGFIGSPAMNFLSGKMLDEQEGKGRVAVAGGKLALPRGRALPSVGQAIEIGVRPEHLFLVDPEKGDLRGRVEVVEPMGWDAHVHVRLAGAPASGGRGRAENDTLPDRPAAAAAEKRTEAEADGPVVIVRAEAAPVAQLRAGATVGLRLPPEGLHLFDAGSGRAIGAPPGGEDVPTVPAATAAAS